MFQLWKIMGDHGTLCSTMKIFLCRCYIFAIFILKICLINHQHAPLTFREIGCLFINFTTLQLMRESSGRGLQDTKSHIKSSLRITRNTHAHTHTRKTDEALKH